MDAAFLEKLRSTLRALLGAENFSEPGEEKPGRAALLSGFNPCPLFRGFFQDLALLSRIHAVGNR